MPNDFVGAGEAARITGAKSPKCISDLFYQGDLRTDLCPLVGGRRMIPRDYLDQVRTALKRRNWLKPEMGAEVLHGG